MKRYVSLLALCLLSLPFVHSADQSAEKPMIGTLSVGKVLFLGNSITLHGPAPQIGWEGNWGMAASAEDLDYVHLLTADIAKAAGTRPQIMVKNVADFERAHANFDVAKEFEKQLAFQPDLVILAIGENVPELESDELKNKYAAAFKHLLKTLKQNDRTTIFVRSSFWPNQTKDEIMRAASADAGVTFVDISDLGRDKSNAASAERKFDHAGVAAHPGDKGMRAIADALFEAIKKKATPLK